MTGLKEAKYKAVGYLGVRILYLKRGISIYPFGAGADYTRLRCGGGAYRCGHIEMAAADTCTESVCGYAHTEAPILYALRDACTEARCTETQALRLYRQYSFFLQFLRPEK
jgi:hypothetical protein